LYYNRSKKVKPMFRMYRRDAMYVFRTDESSDSDCEDSDFDKFAQDPSEEEGIILERDNNAENDNTNTNVSNDTAVSEEDTATSEREKTPMNEMNLEKENELESDDVGANSLAVQIRGLALRNIGDRVRGPSGVSRLRHLKSFFPYE
jgi:hypothetical protein